MVEALQGRLFRGKNPDEYKEERERRMYASLLLAFRFITDRISGQKVCARLELVKNENKINKRLRAH
mgnify:CR=1 FL=1